MDGLYFLIGTDGRHHGPLSQDDVRTWLNDGRANRYSRARRDPDTQWAALKDMPEFEEATRPPYLGGGTAIREAADADVASQPYPDQSAAVRVDPVACFKRAWFLVIGDYLVLGGWTLLVALLISTITLIPRVGVVIGAVVNNLLMCGVYLLFIERIRGHRATFDEITATLRKMALRIVAGGIVQSIVTAPLVMASLAAATSRSPGSMIVLGAVFLPSVYLLVSYVFMLPLIADRELSIWRAMETSRRAVHRQWFPVFGLLLAAGMLLFISAAALGVGLVLTLPLCTGALMFAYMDLFGSRRS